MLVVILPATLPLKPEEERRYVPLTVWPRDQFSEKEAQRNPLCADPRQAWTTQERTFLLLPLKAGGSTTDSIFLAVMQIVIFLKEKINKEKKTRAYLCLRCDPFPSWAAEETSLSFWLARRGWHCSFAGNLGFSASILVQMEILLLRYSANPTDLKQSQELFCLWICSQGVPCRLLLTFSWGKYLCDLLVGLVNTLLSWYVQLNGTEFLWTHLLQFCLSLLCKTSSYNMTTQRIQSLGCSITKSRITSCDEDVAWIWVRYSGVPKNPEEQLVSGDDQEENLNGCQQVHVLKKVQVVSRKCENCIAECFLTRKTKVTMARLRSIFWLFWQKVAPKSIFCLKVDISCLQVFF